MTVTIPKNALIVVADGAHVALYRNTSDSDIKIERAGELVHHTANDHLENKGAARTPQDTSPKEQGEAGFAKRIADDLYERVHKGGVNAVVLIADPQTLGQIRPSLAKEVTAKIVCELHKDLVHSSIHDIERSIKAATSAA